jgi:predicted metalloprotease
VIQKSNGAQTPETWDSLEGRFAFRAPAPPASPPAEASPPSASSPPSAAATPKPSDDIGAYVANILGNIEREWDDFFRQIGLTYRKPVLVLYRGATQAACGGVARRSMGPFYCPQDQKIYLDSLFFREVESQFHGCGDSCEFAQAYLIAHEVGHHVQNQLGILAKVQNTQQRQPQTDRTGAARLQTRMELQADCFAGFWVHLENERFRKEGKPPLVEAGDIEAGLRGASTAGDEMVRREVAGKVMPDNFNHGTVEQRSRWFNAGYQANSVAACNTFKSTD